MIRLRVSGKGSSAHGYTFTDIDSGEPLPVLGATLHFRLNDFVTAVVEVLVEEVDIDEAAAEVTHTRLQTFGRVPSKPSEPPASPSGAG